MASVNETGPTPSPPTKLARTDAGERRAEDDRLVARLRAGDPAAFEALYRRHASGIFGLLLRMLQNRADAEDLLQEIFLQAHDKLPGFEGRSAFGTWLYRLAVNRWSLDLIAQTIDESRNAIATNPDSSVAQESLFEAFRRKVSLLRNTVLLINEVRKGEGENALGLIDEIRETDDPSNPI